MSFTVGSQAENWVNKNTSTFLLFYNTCSFDSSWSAQALQKWAMVVMAEPCSSIAAGLVEVWLSNAGDKGSRLSRDIMFLKNVDNYLSNIF